MKKQIKDSFQQIHAPQALIDDTKRKVHEAAEGKGVTAPAKYSRKSITNTVGALAACVVLMVIGYEFLKNDSSFSNVSGDSDKIADFTDQSDSLNGTGNTSMDGFTFEGTKQLNDWYQLLENSDLKGKERIQLDENYVIFSFNYPKGEEEYQINILIEGGDILLEDEKPFVQGDFQAEVYHQGKQLAKTSLNITSSCQFTSKDATIELQDVDQDGRMDFLLETEHTGENDDISAWFTLNESGSVIEIK